MTNEIYCPIEAGHVDEIINKQCPCGWPERPCIKTWPELHTDVPPEPGCIDDGETWASR